MNETVTISLKQYMQLLDASIMLECLEAQGVDNWEGYHLAWREARALIDDEATEEEYMAEENETL